MSAPPPLLSGIRACVFDAYGTLFDVSAAAAEAREALGEKSGLLAVLWREKQLQYTWLRGLQQRHADFLAVTANALTHALAALGIASPRLHARLMEVYLRLPAYPEVPDVLRTLKARGYATAILSNGTPGMLAAAVESAGLTGLIDKLISVEEVGVFKPHPRVYQRALVRLGISAGQVSFQSSNGWDAYAASAFGMRVVWCNRSGQADECLPGQPDAIVRSLAALPALLG